MTGIVAREVSSPTVHGLLPAVAADSLSSRSSLSLTIYCPTCRHCGLTKLRPSNYSGEVDVSVLLHDQPRTVEHQFRGWYRTGPFRQLRHHACESLTLLATPSHEDPVTRRGINEAEDTAAMAASKVIYMTF